MKADTGQKRLEALRIRKAQIEAELARLQARARAESRKTDTRRKVLVGAVILREMERRSDLYRWVHKLLSERLFKDRDRALFGLSPIPVAMKGSNLREET